MKADTEHPDTSHHFYVSYRDTNDNVVLQKRYKTHSHIISPHIVGSLTLQGWAPASDRLELYVRPHTRLSDFAQLLRVGDLMANDMGHLGVWLGNFCVFRSASPKRSCNVMYDVDIFIGKRLA